MLFSFTGNVYHQIILEAIRETEQVMVGNECGDELHLAAFIKENYQTFISLECILIDISALKDSDDEIIKALDMLRIANSSARIVIIAPLRKKGDSFLAQCFSMSIFDIITTSDYVEMKEQIIHSIKVGSQYADSISYKDVSETEESTPLIKKVDHVIIGVIGTQERIGVTHHSIMLACFLRRAGYRVAYVECNMSDAVQDIATAFELPWKQDYFTKDGIDYYMTSDYVWRSMEKQAYNFIVCDFGNYKKADREMFNNCHKKLVISGIKPWEEHYLQEFFEQYKTLQELKELYYYFNYGSESVLRDIKSGMAELSECTYMLDYTDEPFRGYEMAGIQEVLEDYLPGLEKENEKKKKKMAFRKI